MAGQRNQNQNPNQNVQKISAEKCNEGPRIVVVMHMEELEQELM
jgi:hypothetical protein